MTALAKIKETLVEYATLTVLGLIVLLLLILWQAVPASFWTGVSEVVPKNVLWALLGLTVIGLVLETIYTIQIYLKSIPKLIHFSGVLWDRDHNLFCPKDETPLFQSGRSGYVAGQGVEVFQCPKCDREFSFKNEEGSLIRFGRAQQDFIEKLQILPGKNFRQIKPPSIDDYFDDCSVEVLKKFGTTITRHIGIDELVKVLSFQPATIGHHIDILAHKNFIKKTGHTYTATNNPCYELTEIGRAYLVKNDLIF